MSDRLESMQCAVDATAKLSAVRAVLGKPHAQKDGACVSGCWTSADRAEPWPCFHEEVRRAVEGD